MLFRQVRYFQEIVRQGSFTEAAEVCYISQSAISQQIQALEKELGVQLFERRNRKAVLTPAGEHFYNKTVVLAAEFERVCRETARIARREEAVLSLGYLKSYSGEEFHLALADFSAKYPEVQLNVTEGSHEELYDALRFGRADLVLNDQRRAFADGYGNLPLAERRTYLEIAAHSPMADLDRVDIADLSHTPCILVTAKGQEKIEETYYREIVGFGGEFLFAETLQQPRILVVAGRGILPVEGVNGAPWFGSGIRRVPLCRGEKPVTRTYCSFWKEDNAGAYVEAFARLLQARFTEKATA